MKWRLVRQAAFLKVSQCDAFSKAAAENHERVRNVALDCKTLFGAPADQHLPMVKAAMERDRLAREGLAPWTPGSRNDFAALIARAERRERRRPASR